MRGFLKFAAGVATGTLAMYYLDKQSGARRRALVRDKCVAAGHDAADLAEAQAKRAADKLLGMFARGVDRVTGGLPESDQQLHERVRSRIGRVVSHPKAIQVEVDQGEVCLRGKILTSELNGLLSEVEQTPGVTAVTNELTCHDTAQSISELQGSSTDLPRREIY